MNLITVKKEDFDNLDLAIMEISIPDGNLRGARHVIESLRLLDK